MLCMEEVMGLIITEQPKGPRLSWLAGWLTLDIAEI